MIRSIWFSIACTTSICACTSTVGTHEFSQTGACKSTLDCSKDGYRKVNPERGMIYYLPRRDIVIAVDSTSTAGKFETEKNEWLSKQKAAEAEKAEPDKEAAYVAAYIERLEQTGGDTQLIEKQRTRLVELRLRSDVLSRLIAKAKTEVARLDEKIAKQEDAAACKVVEYKFSFSYSPYYPDTSRHYVAHLHHNPFRDDVAVIKTTEEGLLTSADVKATDQTGAIIVEIASAIAGIPIPVAPVTSILKWNEATNLPLFNNKVACPGEIKGLKLRFDPTAKAADPLNIDRAINDELQRLKVPKRLRLTSLDGAGDISSVMPTPAAKGARGRDGLIYRRPVQYALLLKNQKVGPDGRLDDDITEDVVLVSSPNGGPLGFAPMRSSPFVKVDHKIEFSNGMLTSYSEDRPSEILSVAGLPLQVAKAIVQVPAELIQLRINYNSAQAGQIDSILKLEKAIEDLKKAQVAASGAPPID